VLQYPYSIHGPRWNFEVICYEQITAIFIELNNYLPFTPS